MPQTILTDLLCIFEEEACLYEQLLDILLEERQAIIEGASQRLSQIVQEETKLVQRIQGHERKRGALVRQACRELGLTDGALKLSTLRPLLPESRWEQRIDTLSARLEQLDTELSTTNGQITELVSNALDYTRVCLNALTESASIGASYDRTGRRNQDKTSAFVNREL